jgi:Ca-activated chloride channel family protein
MDFAAPHYLLFLALLPLVAAGLRWSSGRAAADLNVFGDPSVLAPSSALPRRRSLATRRRLAIGALVLLVVALARPQLPSTSTPVVRGARELVFVLDVSRSMEADDLAPSRLQAARAAIRQIAGEHPDDLVGLVVFAGSAFLQLPPTVDRQAFEAILEQVSPADLPDPGSDLAHALATASLAFADTMHEGRQVVVLASDGESFEGDLDQAVDDLDRKAIRVLALGMGTTEGGRIPEGEERRTSGYHRDPHGRIVVSRLDVAALRRLADGTDGAYFEWNGGAGTRDLTAVLARIERPETRRRLSRGTRDGYQWPLGVALAIMLVELAISDRAGARRGRGNSTERWSGTSSGRWSGTPSEEMVDTSSEEVVDTPSEERVGAPSEEMVGTPSRRW